MKGDNFSPPHVWVPPEYPASLIFVDESGTKTSGGRFFVMAAVKIRKPGELARAVADLRDRHDFRKEFKFGDITDGTRTAYYAFVDVLAESDACIHATVVNRDEYDPFQRKEQWEVQLEVASLLIRGAINRRELVSVVLDHVTTPRGVNIEDQLRNSVNRKLKNGSVVTAMSADSRSSDLLQAADIVASSIGFDRRRLAGVHGSRPPSSTSPKAKVTSRLLSNFDRASFEDGRDRRLNVQTLRAERARTPLGVVRANYA